MDSYRISHADTHTFRPQFHNYGPPNTSTFHENQKNNNNKNTALLAFSELFSQTPLTKILGPNLWAKNDPMVILSLSTFREKHDLTGFSNRDSTFSWKTTFSF